METGSDARKRLLFRMLVNAFASQSSAFVSHVTSRSQPIVHRAAAQVGGLDVGIVLCQVPPHDLQIGVPEKALQREYVHAIPQHVECERAPKVMRSGPLRKLCFLPSSLQQLEEAVIGEVVARLGHEECWAVITPLSQVGTHGAARNASQKHCPALASFAVPDDDLPGVQVGILQLHMARFTGSRARIKQEEKDSAISFSGEGAVLAGIDERSHILQRDGFEGLEVHFRWLDLQHGIAPLGWHDLFHDQPAEERAERAEIPMHAAGIVCLGQFQEVTPEQVRTNVLDQLDAIVATIDAERMEVLAVEFDGAAGEPFSLPVYEEGLNAAA